MRRTRTVVRLAHLTSMPAIAAALAELQTTVPGSPYGALAVQMTSGQISGGIKRDPVNVWPVRGGN
jgi:NADPH-dependent ferric siderophore reductase